MHFEDHELTATIGGRAALGVVDPDGWLRCRIALDYLQPPMRGEEAMAIFVIERFEDDDDGEPNYDQWPVREVALLPGDARDIELELFETSVRLSVSPEPLDYLGTTADSHEVHVVAPKGWRWAEVDRFEHPADLCDG